VKRQIAWTSSIVMTGLISACMLLADEDRADRLRAEARQKTLAAALIQDEHTPPIHVPFRVRLAFSAEADLDLSLGLPDAESISVRSPTDLGGAGGRFSSDAGCDTPAPRIETIVVQTPPKGRYRIGIDFSEPCGSHYAPAAFVLVTEIAGQRKEFRGLIAPFHSFEKGVEIDTAPIDPE